MTKRNRNTRRSAGFTLLEVLIVLALIGMVTAMIGSKVYEKWELGRERTARIQVREAAGDVLQYMVDNDNECPKSLEDLSTGPLGTKVAKDPWGNPLHLRCPGEEAQIEVFSAGRDEAAGSKDDIRSWDER